jgi:opacity protein-like surface antigen
MTRLGRLLAIAAALHVTAGAATAAAQTVMVRHAPPGITVEVLLNDTVVATGTTNPEGDVSLEFKMPEPGEMDANVFVDVCEKSRRVSVVERNKRPAPPPAGCERREVSGVYWVRRVNTLVVDVAPAQPSMLLVKGSYTPPKPTVEGEEPVTERRQAPIGLSLFGGGGLSKFRDQFLIACGNATPCDGHDGGLGYSFGATFWLTRWLGAEGSYLKPRAVKAHGGDTFAFDSNFDVDLFTVAAKVAIPAGPARIYGLVGTNFHQSTLTSTETIDNVTQAFGQKTHGWGYLFGGGTEIWVTPKVALYGELSLAQVKGTAEDKGEGLIDDRLRFIGFGVKVRLSR